VRGMRSRTGAVRRAFLGVGLTVLLAVFVFGGIALFAGNLRSAAAVSQSVAGTQLGKSGLPVPRFVSLKAGRVNVRVGPGEDYKVAWVFTRSALPVEIVAEFDNWRRIRDSDGQVGWVFHSLLSGKRTAVVAPWQTGDPLAIRADAASTAGVTAWLQPGVLATVDRCRGGWCELAGDGFSGWIEAGRLWGVYPDEAID
jgi:SH3-like domain-containing protein